MNQTSLASRYLRSPFTFICVAIFFAFIAFVSWNIPGQVFHNGGGRAKTWDLVSGEYVRMHVEDSLHYHVDDHEHDAEYAQLLPAYGHLVRIPGDSQSYTVAMFHQLRCLDVIHTNYLKRNTSEPTRLAEHCLNYLRQAILCESSTRLESVRKDTPPKIVELTGEYRCRDWMSLYAAAAVQGSIENR